jgi:serine/threonine protein kinase
MGWGGGLLGDFADRYRIEREVGHGAMARVYLARDLSLNRDVAVKKLNPELSAALGAERFLREIEILTHLNHPHILPLLDKGEADGLLCYVMPYIAGESLRHRLRRETQLRIEDAIAITRDVAGALDYAHRQGIVHRDIKPENILMSEGLALVADFGIARAITLSTDDETLTQAGVSPGTPPYMSPEQALGAEVDGRSDIYALGCVLYELLAGQPPFTGPSTQAILARHLADPVPPLRTVRSRVPVEVESAILRALEKVPADRFATAGSFAAALTVPTVSRWWPQFSRRELLAAGIVLAASALFLAGPWRPFPRGSVESSGLDTTNYIIFPFERDSGLTSINEDQQLQDAMLGWGDVRVVDRSSTLDAMSRHGGRVTSENAASIARELGAGRYVLSRVSRIGDSLRIQSAVYGASATGPPFREGIAKTNLDLPHYGAAFARVADRLLFADPGLGATLDRSSGTSSRAARQALERGLDSVFVWNLAKADTAFSAATQYDPSYSVALMWLATVRSWNGASQPLWQSAAERAAVRRESLSDRDRDVAEALLAQSRGEPRRACEIWRRSAQRYPGDFVPWYGWAQCQASDQTVVRDPRSPSGWSFQTSFNGALLAYQRAFSLLPSILRAFRGRSFVSLRRLFKTSGNELRKGWAVGSDTIWFDAAAEWNGDTLAFVPYPSQQTTLRRVSRPGSRETAVRELRKRFHAVTLTWATSLPQSADAMEALAVSLQMLGDPAALDTLGRARSLVRDPAERLSVAASEVWMLLAFGLPGDTAAIHRARELADSLLRDQPPSSTSDPMQLASLAAVTGRANLLSAYYGDPRVADALLVPYALRKSALALLAYAALGGPKDTLAALEREVRGAIEDGIPLAQRDESRVYWIGRPATLAFPVYRFASMADLAGKGDWLIDLQAAWERGDSSAVKKGLDSVRAARQGILPPNLTMDALYPEADLLDEVGDSVKAAEWLAPTLEALSLTAPETMASPERAATLVHAMALEATLADRLGDRQGARRWAAPVILLWSDADAFLQPLVRHLRQLGG